MDNRLDLSRWRERPNGLGYRRWTIVAFGLNRLLRGRFFRVLLVAAWIVGTLAGTATFLFAQSVIPGGWFDSLASHFGPRGHAVAEAVGGFVLLYPDICIHGFFTAVFWYQAGIGLWMSLVALTVLVPQLVTKDRATHALTIYLSRPLTSVDYLLGKLGVIVGTILLLWTGPLIFGWLVSLACAPNADFVAYSVSPFLRALLFNGLALVVLAMIAMGVSAASRSSGATIATWLGLWLVVGALATNPAMPRWLRAASFSHDLREVRGAVFRLDEALAAAGTLPVIERTFSTSLHRAADQTRATDLAGALGGLIVLGAVSSTVLLRKFRPE